jgi:hypothetical protein
MGEGPDSRSRDSRGQGGDKKTVPQRELEPLHVPHLEPSDFRTMGDGSDIPTMPERCHALVTAIYQVNEVQPRLPRTLRAKNGESPSGTGAVELPSEDDARQDQGNRNAQVRSNRNRTARSHPRTDDFRRQAQNQKPQRDQGA